MNPDLLIGGAFAVVFVTYGFALVQRLKAYRAAVQAALQELMRRKELGLATAEAAEAYEAAAEALNDVLVRFPSNLVARALAITPVPTLPPSDAPHTP